MGLATSPRARPRGAVPPKVPPISKEPQRLRHPIRRSATSRRSTARGISASSSMLGAQQSEGVLDALLEDLVGELPIGKGAGDLERPDQQREDAERLHTCPMRVVRRQARSDVVDHYQQAVGVRALCGVRRAPDLVEQRSGWAAAPGVVSVLNREIRPHDLLESGAARRLRAEALALLA